MAHFSCYFYLAYEMIYPVIRFDQYHFFLGVLMYQDIISEYYTCDQCLIHLQREALLWHLTAAHLCDKLTEQLQIKSILFILHLFLFEIFMCMCMNLSVSMVIVYILVIS